MGKSSNSHYSCFNLVRVHNIYVIEIFQSKGLAKDVDDLFTLLT